MRVVAPKTARETVERTHGIYAMRCPLILDAAQDDPTDFLF
jgi:hypothetical protein